MQLPLMKGKVKDNWNFDCWDVGSEIAMIQCGGEYNKNNEKE